MHRRPLSRRAAGVGLPCLILLGLALGLAACATPAPDAATALPTRPAAPTPTAAPALRVDLVLAEQDLKIQPLPVRAGFPFTITATVHNRAPVAARDVPVMFYLAPVQDQIGYQPFLRVITATVPATQTATVQVPVRWNLAGGVYRLWVQANRLPDAWQPRIGLLPEDNVADNAVLQEWVVDPFDAYTSELCAGRVDVTVDADSVRPQPDGSGVVLRVHNLGNQALYNLPVVVMGSHVSGIGYTPAIPPCGGTAEVAVRLDRALQPGEALTIEVNPEGWPEGQAEDDFDNNRLALDAGLPGSSEAAAAPSPVDYDFALTGAGVDLSRPGVVVLTVQNLGTRDAAMVPVRIEGKSRRKLNDAVPLVEGGGRGVVAIALGDLGTPGASITIVVNPEGVGDAYPEADRQNNSVTVTLP